MSQAGYTPISLYYSTTAAAVPTSGNLVAGELALNTLDGKLYYKNSSGTVTLLASAAGASGDVVGPASATDNALARFDTTTGKLIQNSVGILSDAGILTGLTGLTSSGSITLSSLTSGRVPYASTGGLLVDSANLQFDGTSLTVNTLSITNSITVSGSTANGVFYSNGSKVLTSGTAFTFNGTNVGIGLGGVATNAKLEVFASSGEVFRADASGGAFRIVADQTNVSLNGGSNVINYVAGSEIGRFTSTGLGIGTSAPLAKLDVISGTNTTLSVPAGVISKFSGSITLNSLSTASSGNIDSIYFQKSHTSGINISNYELGIIKSFTGNGFTGGLDFFTGKSLGAGSYGATFAMRIDETQQVGIGTTSPFTLLQVGARTGAGTTNPNTGSVLSVSKDGATGIDLGANVNANAVVGAINWINYYGVGNYNTARIDTYADGQSNSGALRFWTAATSSSPTERMRITNAGDVGIGVTSPSTYANYTTVSIGNTSGGELDFYASGTNVSQIYGNSLGTTIASIGGRNTIFMTNGSERMRITSAGFVGIGTTPSFPLDVYRGSSGVVLNLQGVDAYSAETAISMATQRAKISAFLSPTGGFPGADLRFSTTPDSGSMAERVRITRDGAFCVGTTSIEGNARIGTLNSENGIVARTTATANSYEAIVASRTATVGKIITLWYDLTAGTQAGFINIDSASSVSLNNTSDYRVKEDIQPLTNSIARIQNLKPVSFKFKADGYFAEGFIAHEFAEVIPQAVHGEKDAVDENGKPVYQAIDQSKIVPLLTAALQEQQAIIESLKARLDAANL